MINKKRMFNSDDDAFTCEIEDGNGVVLYTKKLSDFDSARGWCFGMVRDTKDGAFRILDTSLNKCLFDYRRINGEIADYNQSELKIGTEVEMEHREIISALLVQAYPDLSGDALENKIMLVAKEIARVHIKEDPEYYTKLKKIEG